MLRLEGFVNTGAAREARVISDQGVVRQPLKRQRPIQQRVPRRHDDAVRPAVARKRDQFLILGKRLGSDAHIGFAGQQHFGHLFGRTLVQVKFDAGKLRAKRLHGYRQGVTRLGVCGGNRQQPTLLGSEFSACLAQVAAAQQDAFNDGQYVATRVRQAGQSLACAHKEFNAEFLLQFANLPANARLRGVQLIGHFGEVEAATHRRPHGAQLLKIHNTSLLNNQKDYQMRALVNQRINCRFDMAY